MFGWYRRYKLLKTEHAELIKLVSLLTEQNEILKGLDKKQQLEIALLRKHKKLLEENRVMTLALLARDVYLQRDLRITVGLIFKSLTAKTCQQVVKEMTRK